MPSMPAVLTSHNIISKIAGDPTSTQFLSHRTLFQRKGWPHQTINFIQMHSVMYGEQNLKHLYNNLDNLEIFLLNMHPIIDQ